MLYPLFSWGKSTKYILKDKKARGGGLIVIPLMNPVTLDPINWNAYVKV